MTGKRDRQKALAKFNELISKYDELVLLSVSQKDSESFQSGIKLWVLNLESAIRNFFGKDSDQYRHLHRGLFTPANQQEQITNVKSFLASIYSEINDYWDDEKQEVPKVISSNKIFIIHGHNHAIVDKIVAYLGKVDIKPTVLHEKPNQGKTLIEKLEHNAKDIGFAVSLWTADDVGKANMEDGLKKRARQNVVFETGLFQGLIGRSRLAIVYEKDVDIFSDYQGVAYILIDNQDSWLFNLVKEIKAAGIDIDLNKLA